MNKKVIMAVMLCSVQVLLCSCMSGKNVENTKYEQQISALNEKNMQMEEKIQELETENDSLKEYVTEAANLKRDYYFIKMEYEYCFLLPEIYQKGLSNVFHPGLLKIGDQISDLKVNEINEGRGRGISFDGQFTAKLKITQDKDYEYDEPKYTYEVVNSFDNKVAKDIFTYSKNNNMRYELDDSSKELIKMLGNSYHEGIEVTVLLDNYSISYDSSDYVNRARFIKLISVD